MTEEIINAPEEYFEVIPTIEGNKVVSVPTSRRGPLTANNLLQMHEVIEKHGKPSEIEIVPIPGVPLPKYLRNLTNGLPRTTQWEIASNFIHSNGSLGIPLDNATEIPCEWVEFREKMINCGQIVGVEGSVNNTLNELESEKDGNLSKISNLGDAFAVWDSGVLQQYLRQVSNSNVSITAQLPSETGKAIQSQVGPVDTENALDLFPESLRRRLAKRVSDTVLNKLLPAFIDGDNQSLTKDFNQFALNIRSALQNTDWSQLSKIYEFDDHGILNNPEGSANRFFVTIYEKAEIDPETNGWDIFSSMNADEISINLINQYLVALSDPSKLFLAINDKLRPKTSTQNENPTTAFYSGANVLTYILQQADKNEASVIMQDLSNRVKTLHEAVASSGVRSKKIKAVFAQPELSLPMQDQSVFLLMQ